MKKSILLTVLLMMTSSFAFAKNSYTEFLLKKNTESPSWSWQELNALPDVKWEMKNPSHIQGYKTDDVLILRGKIGESKVIWAEGNKLNATMISFGSRKAKTDKDKNSLWKKGSFFKTNETKEIKAECTSKNVHIYKWQKIGYHPLYIKDEFYSSNSGHQSQDFLFSFDEKTICNE